MILTYFDLRDFLNAGLLLSTTEKQIIKILFLLIGSETSNWKWDRNVAVSRTWSWMREKCQNHSGEAVGWFVSELVSQLWSKDTSKNRKQKQFVFFMMGDIITRHQLAPQQGFLHHPECRSASCSQSDDCVWPPEEEIGLFVFPPT